MRKYNIGRTLGVLMLLPLTKISLSILGRQSIRIGHMSDNTAGVITMLGFYILIGFLVWIAFRD